MPIQWERMMIEFDQMKEFDRLRAVTKEQMEWLTEVAQSVPSKDALDLGFGCGFSAVAMVRGGCSVTCVNNEAANVPRRIEAEQRYARICGQPPTIIEAATDSALPRLCDERRKFGSANESFGKTVKSAQFWRETRAPPLAHSRGDDQRQSAFQSTKL